jgi:prepilin-type processing-associated H-X9-DG protein/prepilin-type N-terminal cleavage/methylation domain-containing protein
MHNRIAFTLIELLVVISIVALLAAMLMPVLGMVRRSAHGAVCGSNMRQCVMAIELYVEQNDSYFPYSYIYRPSPWDVNSDRSWLSPMMAGQFLDMGNSFHDSVTNSAQDKRKPIARCPADRRPVSGYGYQISYGASLEYLDQWLPGSPTLGRSAATLNRPAQRAVLVDGTNPRWVALGNYQQVTVDDQNPQDGGNAGNWTIARHGGCNIAFLDGHVERFRDPIGAARDGKMLLIRGPDWWTGYLPY